MKKVTARQLKRLPVGTNVYITTNEGNKCKMWISQTYKKKFLKGVFTEMDIKDRAGWTYEVEE